MKKILLISPFFHPEKISTGFFNTKIVEGLENDKNNIVDIWCFHPFYPEWKSRISDDKKFGNEVIRMGANIPYPKKLILRRLILEVTFAFLILYRIIKNKKKYDVVISHVPPSLFIFSNLFFRKGTKKIILVADLQSVHFNSQGSFFKKLIFKSIKYIEQLSFNMANRIIFMSDSMLEHVGRSNINKNIEIEVCYPGTTLLKNSNEKFICPINTNDVNIVYSGALGEKQIPFELFELFHSASLKAPGFNFFILSKGSYFEEIKKRGSKIGTNVKFLPLVEEGMVKELYKRSTIQIVPQKKGTSNGSLPSKVANLILTKTPIFSITDSCGDLSKILDTYPLGFHTSSHNISDMTEELFKSIEIINDYKLSDKDIDVIDNLILNKFSFKNFLKKLI